MNKWKIAFWICFVTLIVTLLDSFYSILDQAVTITHQKDGYVKTESDLKILIEITRKTQLSKAEILSLLQQSKKPEDFLVKGDTLFLNRICFQGQQIVSGKRSLVNKEKEFCIFAHAFMG